MNFCSTGNWTRNINCLSFCYLLFYLIIYQQKRLKHVNRVSSSKLKFWGMEFRFIVCYKNKRCVNNKIREKILYNQIHDILSLFAVLPKFSFTIYEYIPVAKRLAKRLRTYSPSSQLEFVLHKIMIALKFMPYINSDLPVLARKLQTPG